MPNPYPSDSSPAWELVGGDVADRLNDLLEHLMADAYLVVLVYDQGPVEGRPGVLRGVGGVDAPQRCKDLVRRLARDLEPTIEEATGSSVTRHP